MSLSGSPMMLRCTRPSAPLMQRNTPPRGRSVAESSSRSPIRASLRFAAFAAKGSPEPVATEAAQKSEELGFKKREEESKAAGVVSWRPPRGGDPPPPPGQPWAWSLNWDPVYYEEDKLKIIVGACPKEAAHVDRLVEEAGVEAILCLQSDDCFSAMGIDIEGVQKQAAKRGVFWARVAVRDFDRLDQAAMLPEMVRVLSLLVATGRRAYVHCTAGINRANLSVLGYLTWAKGMEYDAALSLIKEARPQANPYKVSWDVAHQRLLAGRDEDMYLSAVRRGTTQADGGDWIARDMSLARTAVLTDMFRRRTDVDLQLVASAGGLGRRPGAARKAALTARGAKPRGAVNDEDYDSYDDDSSEDDSDGEEGGAGEPRAPPAKKEGAAEMALPPRSKGEKKGKKKGGKGGKKE